MSFKKYPKVRRPGHPETRGLLADPGDELVVTEKMDGNNFRVAYDGDELRFGSRNCTLESDPMDVDPMFEDVVAYCQNWLHADVLEGFLRALGADEVVLFGENAVQHTIEEYDWDRIPQFQLFDIWVEYDDNRDDHWLDWDEVTMHAEKLCLETVPLVERTTVEAFDPETYDIPASVYRTDNGPAEGVVVRNIDRGVKAKLISEPFAERHTSTRSKDDDSDIGEFLDRYVTRRRVEKNVESLLDSPEHDYEAPVMEMMEHLATEVWEDTWSECWSEVIYENWELDIGNLRSETSSRTASHLRDIMQGQTVVDPGTGETAGEHLEAGSEQ